MISDQDPGYKKIKKQIEEARREQQGDPATVPARRPRSWANACNACKGYPDEEHTMDENCLVPTEIGTSRPEDDALDRLESGPGYMCSDREYEAWSQHRDEALATVREALDARMTRESGQALIEDANRWERAYRQARDESERLRSRIYVLENMRSENYIEALEAAEAEVRRLTQGLREIQQDAIGEDGYDRMIDALLANSPPDGGGAK